MSLQIDTMKKFILLSGLALSAIGACAQNQVKTIYLDRTLQVSAQPNSAYTMELSPVEDNIYSGIIYDGLNQVKAKGNFIEIGKKFLEDGHFVYYYPSGKIESEGEFVRGVKVGNWKRYDQNGQRKPDRYYPVESADKIRETMQLEKNDDEASGK